MRRKYRSDVMFPPTWLCFLLFHFNTSAAALITSSPTDTLNPLESITDDQIVVSTESNFALGFFSPGNSSFRYVGIWYNTVPETTVVWVANRDNPINDSSGILTFALDGNLVVSSRRDQRRPLWSTNISISSNSTFLKLLNSGNLVLYGTSNGTDNTNRILWQSFDHPTHMILAGMKLGLDRITGLNRVLISWKSKDDPGRGNYSLLFDPRGRSTEQFLYKGSAPVWRTGPWNGQSFNGVPEMTQTDIFSYKFVNNNDELYLIYESDVFSPIILDEFGIVQRWIESYRRWITLFWAPKDRCDYYGHCGAYATCRITDNALECACLPGFQPKSPMDWYLREWSDGCVRKRSVGCGKGGDGFLKLVGVKLPDTSMSLVDKSLSLKECERECLKNCSCNAYAPSDITDGGSGCVAWFDNLIDIRYFNAGGGDDLYLRVDAVELATHARKDKEFLHNKRRVAILTASLVVVVLLFAACVYCLLKKIRGAIEKRQRGGFLFDLTTSSSSYKNFTGISELQDNGRNPELPFIELDAVAAATDNFSPNNKLGEGGFGAVYKVASLPMHHQLIFSLHLVGSTQAVCSGLSDTD
ncbi:G-type lectin S-receptor-like serine/threonine-protein kinase At1g11410 [Telopea speciosissima]|uniref:G-type lectin S-receptor-like serine/threonine-protein kinase At1g11410 n=1 Tax=Telopea speciosissima TaxID=54955 RepID=UPI001CC6A6E0|nr:G-type lectin S-receptor-like serine/threonine-protein kinase At1g11410 [Telopea speciosissima]